MFCDEQEMAGAGRLIGGNRGMRRWEESVGCVVAGGERGGGREQRQQPRGREAKRVVRRVRSGAGR